MNRVEIFNEYKEDVPEKDEIKKLVDYAIKYQKLDKLEFNIIFVDDIYIHELNKNYRGVDRPTDVISFALEDGEKIDTGDYRMLGDIYISIDRAKAQAIDYGHSFLRELSFLSVHGFLHLLGYDHMKKEDEEVMFGLQEEILNGYGIKRET